MSLFDMEINVTDSSFEKEVIEKSKEIPVLVDFWASWCGPCVMLKPILEKIAKEYEGKMILAKLDVQQNQKSQEFSEYVKPYVKLFKRGKRVMDLLVFRQKANKECSIFN
jgi:putative thioredoxin